MKSELEILNEMVKGEMDIKIMKIYEENKVSPELSKEINRRMAALRIVTLSEVRCSRCNMNASPLSIEGLCSFCNREPYVPEPISGFPYWLGFAVIAFVGALFIAAVWFLGR